MLSTDRPKRFVAQSTVGARTYVRLRSHSAEYCSRPVAHIGIRTRLAGTTLVGSVGGDLLLSGGRVQRDTAQADGRDGGHVERRQDSRDQSGGRAHPQRDEAYEAHVRSSTICLCCTLCCTLGCMLGSMLHALFYAACSVLCCMLCFMLHAPPGTPICSTSTASSSVRRAHQSQSPPV
jgi:hypothetical protein